MPSDTACGIITAWFSMPDRVAQGYVVGQTTVTASGIAMATRVRLGSQSLSECNRATLLADLATLCTEKDVTPQNWAKFGTWLQRNGAVRMPPELPLVAPGAMQSCGCAIILLACMRVERK